MPGLRLSLLGPAKVVLNERALADPLYDKALALLAYLVLSAGQRFRRDHLAELLWPDQPEGAARLNLRQTLFTLRKALQEREAAIPYIDANRDSIAFNTASAYTLDTAAFTAPIPTCPTGPERDCVPCLARMEQQTGLYRGPLLDQLSIPNAPEFEHWLTASREKLHEQAMRLLSHLSTCFEQQGLLSKALWYARRQTELEPWNETAHQHIMRLLARDGKVGAAVQHYRQCCALYAKELGLPPGAALQQLHEEIRRGAIQALPGDISIRLEAGTIAPTTSAYRQATILYYELSGSCNHPQQHEEMMDEQRQRRTRLIEESGGYALPTHGQAGFVYFGYPQAQEHAALTAVRTALQLTAATTHPRPSCCSELALRIGIHSGLIRSGEQSNLPDLDGQASALASHLCQAAAPGEVLLSATSRILVDGWFNFEACGDLPQKNSTIPPIPLFRVNGNSGATSRLDAAQQRGLTPLVGRQAETRLLDKSWQRACTGTSQAILVSGDPGIGKSRLLLELEHRLADEPHVRWRAACYPHYSGSPLYPISELLYQLLEIDRGGSSAQQMAQVEKYVHQFFPRKAETLRLLAEFLALPQAITALPLSPAQKRAQLLSIFRQLLAQHSARQPILLLVEDLHWADPSSLEFLAALLEAPLPLPLLLLFTSRNESLPDALSPLLEQLPLHGLSLQENTTLVAQLASRHRLSTEHQAHIARYSDGIPLFAEEMAKLFAQQPTLASTTTALLPATLHDLLLARLDQMGTAKRVAQLAATIGREFSHDLLAAVADIDTATLFADLKRLKAGGILDNDTAAKGQSSRFHHALLQEAAYQSQLKRDRVSSHRRIAEIWQQRWPEQAALEPEWLARHLAAAGLVEAAIPLWLAAGQRDVRRSANREAVAHLQQGLALLATLPDNPGRQRQELAFVSALGAPLLISQGSNSPAMRAAFARARELSLALGAGQQLLVGVWGLWLHTNTTARFSQALEVAEELLRLAASQGESGPLLQAHYAVGNSLYWLGEFERAQHHLDQAIALYQPEVHDSQVHVYGASAAVSSLSFRAWLLWQKGCPDQAQVTMAQALTLAERLNHPHSTAFALAFAAALHCFRREAGPTGALAACLLMHLEKLGQHPMWTPTAVILANWAAATQGQAVDLDACLQAAQALEWGGISTKTIILIPLAETHACLGDYQAALTLLERIIDNARRSEDRHFEAEMLRLQGEWRLHLAPEEPAGEHCLQLAFNTALRQNSRLLALRSATSLARHWRAQGRSKDGHALLAPLYQSFSEGAATTDLQAANELLSSLL